MDEVAVSAAKSVADRPEGTLVERLRACASRSRCFSLRPVWGGTERRGGSREVAVEMDDAGNVAAPSLSKDVQVGLRA